MSGNSGPSSDLTLRVDITSEYGKCIKVSLNDNLQVNIASLPKELFNNNYVGHDVEEVNAVPVER